MTCSTHQRPQQQFSSWSVPKHSFRALGMGNGPSCWAGQHSSPKGWLDCREQCPVSLSHCECHWCCPCSWGSSIREEGRSQSVQHGLITISFAFHSNSPHPQDSPMAMPLLPHSMLEVGQDAGSAQQMCPCPCPCAVGTAVRARFLPQSL